MITSRTLILFLALVATLQGLTIVSEDYVAIPLNALPGDLLILLGSVCAAAGLIFFNSRRGFKPLVQDHVLLTGSESKQAHRNTGRGISSFGIGVTLQPYFTKWKLENRRIV